MEKSSGCFTVYFDDPYWVGVYQRSSGNKLEVCKITFGPEPKDYQVYEFLLQNWHQLRFSPEVTEDRPPEPSVNPKRMQRQISRQLSAQGVSTKAQQALSQQREENKLEARHKSRQQREEAEQRKFLLKQEKRKQKKRGH